MENSTDPDKSQSFLDKFEKILNLLRAFSADTNATFTENVTCLLDKALDHVSKLELSKERSPVILTTLILNPAIRSFLEENLIYKEICVHTPILVFSVKMVSLMVGTGAQFVDFRTTSDHILTQVEKLVDSKAVDNSDIKHSLLVLFLTLSKHESGQLWLLQSGVLGFIVKCLEDRAIYIRKTAKEIINGILPTLTEQQVKDVLNSLLLPFSQVQVNFDNHQLLSDKLQPYIDVLENYVEVSLSSRKANSFQHIRTMGLDQLLYDLVQKVNNETLLIRLCSLLVGIYVKSAHEDPQYLKINEEKTFQIFQLLLDRGLLRASIMVITNSLYYWSHLVFAKDMQRQLMALMLIPVLMGTEILRNFCEFYDNFISHWAGVTQGPSSLIAGSLTKELENNPELNELTTLIIPGFVKSITNMGKDTALKITQACLYLLGIFKHPDSKRLTQVGFSSQLAIVLIEAVCSFIGVYNIRWWETVETIYLPYILHSVVDHKASCNSQVTCAGLRGIKFCIKQFLHPDQILLVNPKADSTLNDVAKTVDRCLVSIHWEVRDSALEVVREMAQLSQSRYPDFQNLLMRSGLLLSAAAAIQDMEPYVRASAVSVITATLPVPALWEHINGDKDIMAECFSILRNDGEALARRAAAKMFTLAIQSSLFTVDRDRTTLYRMMSSAALFDLDWEVKLHALDFWEVLYKEQLDNQGMLDGHFPEYTFSKEKQKIVRLDKTEIRRRLQRALSVLASCGHLHVLLQSVDDCDTPVKEKAICLLRDLRDLFDSHQALDLSVWPERTNSNDKSTKTAALRPASPRLCNGPITNADQIIEDILDQDDLTLVAEILSKSQPGPMKGDPETITSVECSEFVKAINMMELESMLKGTTVSSDLHIHDLACLAEDLKNCFYTGDSRPHPDCY